VCGSILHSVFKQDRSEVKPRARFSSTHTGHAAPTDLPNSPRHRVGIGRDFVLLRSSVGLSLKSSIKCFLCNGGHKLETFDQFRAKSSEKKLILVRLYRIECCAKALTLILQVVARAHEAVLLSSAPLLVRICNPCTKPWLIVFEVETGKEPMKEFLDQVLIDINAVLSYTRNKVITL